MFIYDNVTADCLRNVTELPRFLLGFAMWFVSLVSSRVAPLCRDLLQRIPPSNDANKQRPGTAAAICLFCRFVVSGLIQ